MASSEGRPQAVVVNSSHPELDQLAAELASRGRLSQYFGRYFPEARVWERVLRGFPLTRNLYLSGPGRRKMPPEFRQTQRFQGGTGWDFASAVPRKLLGARGEPAFLWMQERRDCAIVQQAMRHGLPAGAVLANFSVAERVFHRAAQTDTPRILNYPIAHHAYSGRLLLEEAELHPEFADDLRSQVPGPELSQTLDRECELATVILVGSTFAQQSFIACGVPADKLFVCPYGVDLADFSTGEPIAGNPSDDGVFRAVWLGQVSQRKGIKYLLEAWKQVCGPGMELRIAGHFKAPPGAFTPYAGMFGHEGFLDAAGIRNLLQRASVLVLPTLIEGMPIVVLQAMAAGVPVIVTAHGPGDVVRDGVDGFHVPIRDARAIAEKLTLLRDNPAMRAEMGRSARLRVKTFTWDRYRTQAANFIETLLDGERHAASAWHSAV